MLPEEREQKGKANESQNSEEIWAEAKGEGISQTALLRRLKAPKIKEARGKGEEHPVFIHDAQNRQKESEN